MIRFGQKINTSDSTKKYFVTSDLHFWHKGVLGFCPNTRPWKSVEEMNEAIIEHWNSIVGVDDEVLHLGDFCFKAKEATEAIIERLNGTITFILGNHCKVIRSQIKGLNIYDYLEFNFNGVKICAMHFPIAHWNRAEYGSLMLHGHLHGQPSGVKGRIIDVGWDAHGKILNLGDVVEHLTNLDIVSRRWIEVR